VRKWILVGTLVAASFASAQNGRLTASEAKDHIGEVHAVCGQVSSSRYAAQSKGQPTFLNLDGTYPKEIFTIVIWGSDRAKFDSPESKYQGAGVCVTGKITSYRGAPEIVATDPSQIVLQK
jgi:hypothetical protein